MAAESADDLPGLPAFQVVAHGVVDVGQQLVGGPGICGPDRPVVPDRQLPADGQLGQERARQADLDQSVAPGGNMSLIVHRHQQQHLGDQHDWHAKCRRSRTQGPTSPTPGPYCPGRVLPPASADSTPGVMPCRPGRPRPATVRAAAPGWRGPFRRTGVTHALAPVTRLEWTPALGEPGSHATVMRFGMPGRQRAGLAHFIPIDATDQTAVSDKGQPAGLARQGAKRPRSPAESTSEPGRRPGGLAVRSSGAG